MSEVTDPASASARGVDAFAPDEEVVGYVRSPSDLLRSCVFAVVALILLVLTRWAEETVIGVEEDVIALLGFVPPFAERVMAGAAQVLLVVIAFGVYVPPLVMRRYRLIGYLALGNVITAVLVQGTIWWLDRAQIPQVVNEVAERSGVDVSIIGPASLGQVVAAFVILAPFVSRRWRRAGMALVAILTIVRLLITAHPPAELFVSLALGALVGSAVLLAFGRPDQRPTLGAVRAALTSTGLPLRQIEAASVDARGSTPYFATLEDGQRVFVKALSPEERSADLLFRVYRYLRLKNVGDERPFSTLRRTVEHEALVSLHARDVGVRTPRMRAIAAVGDESMVLTYDLIDGRSLDRLSADEVSDDLLDALWQQVAVLRRHRIAHRDLRRANVFVDAEGLPWIIDFGFSEVAASDRLLAADVAQLVAALALLVGAERAVDSAVDVLGSEAVATGLSFLQPTALSGATRSALKAQKGLLDEVRQRVIERCRVAEPEYAQLERFNGKKLFTIATLALATYFLIPQLADVPGIIDQIDDADWSWFVPVLLLSFVTYLGATMSLIGAIPQRLPFGPTALTQIGSSFASKLAPAGLGGMALNTRFLQKAGVDPAVAVSGVGLNSVAGVFVHMLLLVTFAVWAGRNAFGSIHLPDPTVFLYGIAVVLVLAVGAFAVPAVRAQVQEKLLPILGRSFDGITGTLRRPGRVALLLGGSAVVTLTYIGALYCALQAFGGGGLSFGQVGAIYLAGAAVATAAPTPGGLGALEAAVIAGLVAAGMDNSIAVPGVFLYRLATFWVPILPGWFCFTYLQRSEYI